MEKEFVPYEITLLPTDKPSRLYEFGGQIILTNEPTVAFRNQNIYITNSEEFKDGYFINCGMICKFDESKVSKEWITDEFVNGYSLKTNVYYSFETEKCKKIILTTDQDLIKDGVQAIDDEFLEWFVKNPSCERVEVKEKQHFEADKLKRKNPLNGVYYSYKIIIPKEEPKQEYICYKCQNKTNNKFEICDKCNVGWKEPNKETLEEAAERLFGSLEKGIGADRRRRNR
jgi:hypothetical protein